ncbi:MAG: tRNA (adenosine(37)-N6)-dimethylallyltransferase MiaA [Pseudomonadota bacterium]|nr:tRNA (adenosine(37)-N6)-dimethylallyltransferase MiaA [Pseudomonadota bacterium]
MTSNAQNPVLVVCGPTASGKSNLALDIAIAFGGTVINADSMQLYRELRILTARPSPTDEAQAPHHLYGIASIADTFSAGRWKPLAEQAIGEANKAGSLPIVCGGTGLYLKALMEGLSPMPEIPADIRAKVRQRMAAEGSLHCHQLLADCDPASAARLASGDTQRIARALEVYEATGKPLSAWQAEAPIGPDPAWRFSTILIAPPRAETNAAIEQRFDKMINAGALEEVRTIADLDVELPALKALGVPHLRRHLAGDISLEEAAARSKTATRQFAKRQMTWFKNQIIADKTLPAQYLGSFSDEIFSFIRSFLLTDSG